MAIDFKLGGRERGRRGDRMKKHIQDFRIENNNGRVIGHAWTIEHAEQLAHQGRGRWVLKWIDNQYVYLRQYKG